MLFIHSFTILSFLCSISDRKYTSEVYILLCRSYILMDCSDFILAQPITHLFLRCCDRAKFWTSCCCTVQILRMRIYTCEVCILLCRSYILMDWSDIILAQPITHSLLRCCDRAKYWTSCTVQILRMRIYTCEVCILLCRSYILMDWSDFILAQPITHSLLRCWPVIERILYELLPMQQIMRGRARYVFYYVVATYWWIVLILLLRS